MKVTALQFLRRRTVKIATWNVNGIRARQQQLLDWIGRDRPEIVCLQEIKASVDQVPPLLCNMPEYWCYWHGERAYSGVAMLVHRDICAEQPQFSHPDFDNENRIVTARVCNMLVGSVYVPNGGKDFQAKLRFLEAMERYVRECHASGLDLILCGDMNVTRTDQDVHPKERRPNAIGQLPQERELFEGILREGMTDVGRSLDPNNEELFTWWPPWRNMRQRNIGWRIDYLLASQSLSSRITHSSVLVDVGTSDHAPVTAVVSSQ